MRFVAIVSAPQLKQLQLPVIISLKWYPHSARPFMALMHSHFLLVLHLKFSASSDRLPSRFSSSGY